MAQFGQATIGQLRYGDAGTGSGTYTTSAAFLAANPGLTLQDFSGIAPADGIVVPAPSFAPGFTAASADSDLFVADDTYWHTLFVTIPDAPFCSLGMQTADAVGYASHLTITFPGVGVRAVGFNVCMPPFGTSGVPAAGGTAKFYNGATLLATVTFPAIALSQGVFTTYAGYAAPIT